MIIKIYTLYNKFVKETEVIPKNFTGIIEYIDGMKQWWLNGLLHRLNGPAIEYTDGTKYWYINGLEYSEEQHDLLTNIMKLKGLS